MFRASWRSLLAHKLRLALTAVAVVLGVAFVSGSLVFTDTLSKTFTELFTQVSPDAVVEPDQTLARNDGGYRRSNHRQKPEWLARYHTTSVYQQIHQILRPRLVLRAGGNAGLCAGCEWPEQF